MTLSPAFLDQVRDRTSLSALVGRTVKLTRAGREHKGCCPFHQEKTPSFYVNDDKSFYHCFGCGAHGDAIRWMTEARGLPFIDAVKELAAAAGLDMPAPDPRAAEREERAAGLHGVVAEAADWFRKQLGQIEGAEARAYLDKRGITPATREAFGLGFAPDARGKLRLALKAAGDERLLEAGLLVKPDDAREPYDRFRGRLIIPIRDQRGRAIAFGGRIIGDGEPKYLNSPETPLFDKGRTLFNLDRAGPAARRTGRLVVVEGYLDVLALEQAGVSEAVAPLGTALTEAQLERLWRVTEAPILCFDGDAAGRKAAMRAAERAMPMLVPGRRVAFVTLPEGVDPDDFVRARGGEAFKALLGKPTSLADLVWARETDGRNLSDPDERAALKARLEAFADLCPNGIISAEYKRTFRELFFENFGWKRQDLKVIATSTIKTRQQKSVFQSQARAMLLGLSRNPQFIYKVLETLAAIELFNEPLRSWRDALVNAAVVRSSLDEDAIQQILDRLNLSFRQQRWIEEELLHKFLRPGTDPIEGEQQLLTLVEVLREVQRINEDEQRLTKALIAKLDDDTYLDVETQRQTLRDAWMALPDWANPASGRAD